MLTYVNSHTVELFKRKLPGFQEPYSRRRGFARATLPDGTVDRIAGFATKGEGDVGSEASQWQGLIFEGAALPATEVSERSSICATSMSSSRGNST
jgi:hypothetical protein